jgi:hypothetical protein
MEILRLLLVLTLIISARVANYAFAEAKSVRACKRANSFQAENERC